MGRGIRGAALLAINAALLTLTLTLTLTPSPSHALGSPAHASRAAFEADVGVPTRVAWSHPIGEPPDAASRRPQPRTRCIDDGEFAGAPLGGIGAGSVGRTYRGDFARWHLRVGGHTHRPGLHTFAAVKMDGVATVLSALPGHGIIDGVPGDETENGGGSPGTTSSPRRRRTLPLDGSGGTYRALYPRAWYEYHPEALLAPRSDDGGAGEGASATGTEPEGEGEEDTNGEPSERRRRRRPNVRVAQVQFSPVMPRRYRESSLPVGVMRFVAQNFGDTPADLALMLSVQNPLGSTDVAPLDTRPPRAAWRVAPQSLRHAPFTRRTVKHNARRTSSRAPPPHSSSGDRGDVGRERDGDQGRPSPRAHRWRVVKGVHMYTAGVVNGTLTPVQPWHGGLAVAVDAGPAGDGVEAEGEGVSSNPGGGCDGSSCVTAVPAYDTGDAAEAGAVWDAFETHGGFPASLGGSTEGGVDVGSLTAAAVAVNFTLAPGERRSVRFAIAWDIPLAVFPRGPRFAKRYTRYHPHTRFRRGSDIPRGAAAPELAVEALSRAAKWEADIRRWQQPYVDSASSHSPGSGPKTFTEDTAALSSTSLRRPPWFVMALFNELYYLVDGGTLWGRPLTMAGMKGRMDTNGNNDETGGEDDSSMTRDGDGNGEDILIPVGWGEDGEGGDADDVTGNGGEWGGSLGRFGLLECFDYPLYNTLDVHFYGSWPLALMWPGLDLAVLSDLSAAVEASDDTERYITWTRGKGGAPKRRKIRGTAPHDLGAPFDAPLTSSPNAFDFVDVNGWKDLAPKLMLMLARAHALRGGFGGPDSFGGLPKNTLSRLFKPVYFALASMLRHHDKNGDGLPEHDGGDMPDQTFDWWAARGDSSAYSGGLWLAALRAGAGLARDLGEREARDSLEEVLGRAARIHDAILWKPIPENPTAEGGVVEVPGYYRYDASGTQGGDVVMAAQVMGEWSLATIGAPGVLPPRRVRAALRTVHRVNVRGFAQHAASLRRGRESGVPGHYMRTVGNGAEGHDIGMGAVNGAVYPDGKPDESNLQSQEVWTGISYALASHLMLANLTAEAWETARGVARVTYDGGFSFRTPEAWDADGRFRAAMYLRPGAVWALEHALVMKHRREVRAAADVGDVEGGWSKKGGDRGKATKVEERVVGEQRARDEL